MHFKEICSWLLFFSEKNILIVKLSTDMRGVYNNFEIKFKLLKYNQNFHQNTIQFNAKSNTGFGIFWNFFS